VVRTNFGAEDQARWFAVVSRVILPFLKTPAQGAMTPVYLASSPGIHGITGRFFANRKPEMANKVAYDTDKTARLWRASADLVGMREDKS
jgi:retinol dehydrogenase 14